MPRWMSCLNCKRQFYLECGKPGNIWVWTGRKIIILYYFYYQHCFLICKVWENKIFTYKFLIYLYSHYSVLCYLEMMTQAVPDMEITVVLWVFFVSICLEVGVVYVFVSVLHILGLESARLLLLLLLQFFLLVPQMEDSVVTFRKTLGQQRMEKKKKKKKLGQQETIRRKDS